ncbi:MAG: alpha-galactosidase [Bryobacterales bacterium]|nr:alpha-galactosidase [Bryobacterales bacterium]
MSRILLFVLTAGLSAAPQPDWLVQSVPTRAGVTPAADGRSVTLTNGLISRRWSVRPDCATIAYDNLSSGASLIRGVKPEAVLTLDGVETPVGGLTGQPDYAYLRPQWLPALQANPKAIHCSGYERAPVEARFPWKPTRYAAQTQWPPAGAGIVFHYAAPGLRLDIHYEMYDGIPLLAKWFVLRNEAGTPIRLTRFVSEILALVEQDSAVDAASQPPNYLHVESDYAFHGMDPRTANRTTYFVADAQYETQVSYERMSPVQLESRPPIGPNVAIAPGAKFTSFRTFELAFDSSDRERNGLAKRRMYRVLAPWSTENPIFMHVRQSDAASVKLAIDQAAETGFEMVILSFGSGFQAENEDPAYLDQLRQLVQYGRAKGIELGGYSLLASRKISPEHDAINPATGKPGGAIFGESPCLASAWGLEYFRKLRQLYEATGMTVLEHDGSYPGDVCASTQHPGHEGLQDSQWRQWELIRDYYQWSAGRGIYLNVPDWYFLNGSNKTGMGYRETNWSLPRDRQFLLARQNIYDGTWDKSPSMGWMFVPLTQYHGGGAEATLEPLKDHLEGYSQHLTQNFTSGVQAAYRGPRLFDAPETKAVVKRWVELYKAHRAILDSDVIHLRRPDARDWDGLLHINPALREKGYAALFNPLDEPIRRTITLPLYYTGLTTQAMIRVDGAAPRRYTLDRQFQAQVEVTIPARGSVALIIE